MRRDTIIIAAFAATVAVVIAPVDGATEHTKITTLSCALQLYAQGARNPSGLYFGLVIRPKPFSEGLRSNKCTVTTTGPGTARSPRRSRTPMTTARRAARHDEVRREQGPTNNYL